MNEKEIIGAHQKTSDWLETESRKALRRFSLARSPADRRKARKHLLELKGRLHSEARELERLMGW